MTSKQEMPKPHAKNPSQPEVSNLSGIPDGPGRYVQTSVQPSRPQQRRGVVDSSLVRRCRIYTSRSRVSNAPRQTDKQKDRQTPLSPIGYLASAEDWQPRRRTRWHGMCGSGSLLPKVTPTSQRQLTHETAVSLGMSVCWPVMMDHSPMKVPPPGIWTTGLPVDGSTWSVRLRDEQVLRSRADACCGCADR